VATPLLGKFLGIVSGLSLGTRVSNLKSVALTVLELLAFNSHDRPLRTHKHTHTNKQTHIERTHCLRHSLRSLCGDNKHKHTDTQLIVLYSCTRHCSRIQVLIVTVTSYLRSDALIYSKLLLNLLSALLLLFSVYF